MFLKYKLSKNERLTLSNSEFHHKKSCHVLYQHEMMGGFSGITNGFTPENKRLAMADSSFTWERDNVKE